jgi:hypothetical protein
MTIRKQDGLVFGRSLYFSYASCQQHKAGKSTTGKNYCCVPCVIFKELQNENLEM